MRKRNKVIAVVAVFVSTALIGTQSASASWDWKIPCDKHTKMCK